MLSKEEQEIFYEKTGSLVRAARIKAMLKQEELAKELGFASHISIVNIENGKQKVQLHTLFDISAILNIPIEKLVPPIKTLGKGISNKMLQAFNKEVVKELSNKPEAMERLKDFIRSSNK